MIAISLIILALILLSLYGAKSAKEISQIYGITGIQIVLIVVLYISGEEIITYSRQFISLELYIIAMLVALVVGIMNKTTYKRLSMK